MEEEGVRWRLWKFLLLLGAFLMIIYTSLRMYMAHAQWVLCFQAHSWDNLPSQVQLLGPALRELITDPAFLGAQLAAGMPHLGLIAFTRSKTLGVAAFCILAFGPLATFGPMHSCDQKGCDDCSNLLIFQLGVLAPLGFALLAIMLGRRALFRLHGKRPSTAHEQQK
jgi:hypothetical protein